MTALPPQQAADRATAAAWEDQWYPVAFLRDLDRSRPKAFTLLGNDLVLWWDRNGNRWQAFRDVCPHRLVPLSEGRINSAGLLECPYHGWSYASDGRNLLIKDKAEGDYAPSFDTDNHDLQAVARFAQYRGFMFASLSADVPPLEEHLGDVRSLIDLAVDQAPDGLELVPGVVHYRFQANWKWGGVRGGVGPDKKSGGCPSQDLRGAK